MKKWFIIAAVVIILSTIFFFAFRKSNGQEEYTFAKVERGSIENIVSATGTLNPVTTGIPWS